MTFDLNTERQINESLENDLNIEKKINERMMKSQADMNQLTEQKLHRKKGRT